MVGANTKQPIEFGIEEIMIRKHMLSVARFPAKEMLHNLVNSRYRYSRKTKYGRCYSKRLFISLDGVPVPINPASPRYKLFKKGSRCVKCGRLGNMMSLETDVKQEHYHFHFNLYCVEKDGAVLMTKDHIRPKSKGGRNQMNNYQTMCRPCNCRKADRIERN